SELQNAADSAALAGAQQLYNSYTAANVAGLVSAVKDPLYATAVSNAKTKAKQYAGFNGAGGKSSLTLNDGDITIGFTNSAGNFGQLSLDDANVGASTISSWLATGPTSSDLSALKSSNLLPLSAHDSSRWDWQGSTGVSSSNVQQANDQVGRIFYLPLFLPY